MRYCLIIPLIFYANALAGNHSSILSDEFINYHLKAAIDDIDNEDVFHLIQENVNNLTNAGTSDSSANELIFLIEEGYKIDSFNLAKLIETLTWKNASNNAKRVLFKAIEYKSKVTSAHMVSLIQTLVHADASNNATDIIIKAIEYDVEFGLKERTLLAEISKVVNAKKNVERIRKALHERATKS